MRLVWASEFRLLTGFDLWHSTAVIICKAVLFFHLFNLAHLLNIPHLSFLINMAKPLARKASSASGTRPQATSSNSRVPRKTAATFRAQIHPSATKTVTVGTRPKPAVNAATNSQSLPNSQTRIASLHGAKDADTLALLERIALQQGLSFKLLSISHHLAFFHLAEIDKLNKKIQVTKPVERKVQEIPRPKNITKLQSDMGLANDRRLYSHCRVRSFFSQCHASLYYF
jgi:hypothetical protein